MGEGWLLRNVVKMLRRKLREGENSTYIFAELGVGYRVEEGPDA